MGFGMKACSRCGLLNPDEAAFCSGCGHPLLGMTPPGTRYGTYPRAGFSTPRLAGFWVRFAASVIDGLVLWFLFLPINLLFWVINQNIYFWGAWDMGRGVGSGLVLLFNLARTLVGWAYYSYLTGRYAATLGKKLLGLRVVGEDLQPITYGMAIVREVPAKLLSALACMLGYIWVGLDARKQGWHDKIAGTLVIQG